MATNSTILHNFENILYRTLCTRECGIGGWSLGKHNKVSIVATSLAK
jgi:hypothetical protein